MADAPPKLKSPLYRAFMKGLAIALPAFITIAVFAWVWGLLKDNVVTMIIKALDGPTPFAPRELSAGEMEELKRQYKAAIFDRSQGKPVRFAMDLFEEPGLAHDPAKRNEELDRILKLIDANGLVLRRQPAPHEEPELWQGLTPLGRKRSLNQFVLDEWGLRRPYDPETGRITGYSWLEYVAASLIGMVFVVILGFLARNFFGRRLFDLFEWVAGKAPIIKNVYPHAKQLVDFFFAEKKPIEFDKVVAVEWPRERLWSIGFVTGSGLRTLQEHTGKRYVTVYFPSSPAPMTGYTHFVPVDEVLQLEMTVEEAMKLVISGGVLSPLTEMVRPQSGVQMALARKVDQQVRERHEKLAEQTAQMTKAEVEAARDSNDPPPVQ